MEKHELVRIIKGVIFLLEIAENDADRVKEVVRFLKSQGFTVEV